MEARFILYHRKVTFFSSSSRSSYMARVRFSFGELKEKLAGRVLISGGRRPGEIVLEVPGEGLVKSSRLECIVHEDEIVVNAAYRDDVYGSYEVSPYAVAKWLMDQGMEVEVLEG